MPIGSDARFPLNTDPSLVPAQPAVSQVNLGIGGYNPRAQPLVPLANMQTPMGATSPASSPQPVGSSPSSIMSFLASLFGGGGGPAQGMRGLIQTPVGRGSPGVNSLGNPYGRF
jgi:hypothetical protein